MIGRRPLPSVGPRAQSLLTFGRAGRGAATLMSERPVISVLLPAHNARRYLEEALRSVLAQTFEDFECLVVDDGSTDRTPEVIARYAQADERVRPLWTAHVGVVEALNAGLREARGEVIARMDADDLCEPGRFERQVAHLRENPDCVLVGSWVRLIDPYGSELNELRPATGHKKIEAQLLEANGWAIIHPAVMMRREAVRAAGGYRPQYQWSEDIDLFLRLAEIGRLANLPEVLLRYRQHFSSVNRTRRKTQVEVNRRLMKETYERRGLGPPPGHVPVEYPVSSEFELARTWGWQALANRNWKAARRHAVAAIKHGPFKYHSWTLAYRSIWHPGQ